MMPLQTDQILRLLKLLAEYEATGYIAWTPELQFYVNTNDFFCGGADGEDIASREDIDAIEDAFVSATTASQDRIEQRINAHYAPCLYAARRGRVRPCARAYQALPETIKPLFDAVIPPQREQERQTQ